MYYKSLVQAFKQSVEMCPSDVVKSDVIGLIIYNSHLAHVLGYSYCICIRSIYYTIHTGLLAPVRCGVTS